MKLKQVLEGYNLLETLNTTFDAPVNWSREGNNLVGYGEVDGAKVKLLVEPMTVKEGTLNGINVGFSIWDGTGYTTAAGAVQLGKSAAKLVGAVTNAIKVKINEYDWDFVALIALDNVDTRAKVYNAIATRLMREQSIKYHAFGRVGTAAVIVLSNTHNCQDIIDDIDATKLK